MEYKAIDKNEYYVAMQYKQFDGFQFHQYCCRMPQFIKAVNIFFPLGIFQVLKDEMQQKRRQYALFTFTGSLREKNNNNSGFIYK